jgi:hypothetical protein
MATDVVVLISELQLFLTCPDWPWDPTSLQYSGYQVSFLGVKWLRHGINHLPPLISRLKKE